MERWQIIAAVVGGLVLLVPWQKVLDWMRSQWSRNKVKHGQPLSYRVLDLADELRDMEGECCKAAATALYAALPEIEHEAPRR